jgi:hypothetical protein
MSCGILLLHLKAILTFACLKRLVIFLICGDVWVNVVLLVLCWGSLAGVLRFIFCSVCCLNLIRRLSVKLLFLVISRIVVHFFVVFLC